MNKDSSDVLDIFERLLKRLAIPVTLLLGAIFFSKELIDIGIPEELAKHDYSRHVQYFVIILLIVGSGGALTLVAQETAISLKDIAGVKKVFLGIYFSLVTAVLYFIMIALGVSQLP